MQKIIIDTNILVSSLIQKSYPYLIIRDCLFDEKIEVCISEEIIVEYQKVIRRPKFIRYPDFALKAEELLADIIGRAKKYDPLISVNVLKDADDNRFLELARESNADFLITGNTNDFTLKKYFETIIVTPKEYWELFKTF